MAAAAWEACIFAKRWGGAPGAGGARRAFPRRRGARPGADHRPRCGDCGAGKRGRERPREGGREQRPVQPARDWFSVPLRRAGRSARLIRRLKISTRPTIGRWSRYTRAARPHSPRDSSGEPGRRGVPGGSGKRAPGLPGIEVSGCRGVRVPGVPCSGAAGCWGTAVPGSRRIVSRPAGRRTIRHGVTRRRQIYSHSTAAGARAVTTRRRGRVRRCS